ncbi:MAG: hypothetical protein ACK5B9_12210 [Flavobacteriia bacterium]
MPEIKLIYKAEEAKQAFRKFTAFEQKNEFNRLPLKLLYGIVIILIALGYIFQKQFLIYLGLSSLLILSSYLLYYYMKFKRYFSLISKEIDKNKQIHDQEFVFSFDEKGMSKKFKDFSNTNAWKLVFQYKENEGDLYLYTNGKHLFDIISKKQIGEVNYQLFLEILDKEFTSN